MIKLERSPKPALLTDAKVNDLTDKFKSTGESVWNIDEIKNALRASSHGKCAYCECSVSEESKYMEVEHFNDKHSMPDLVVEWTNLLPACKRCNGTKGSHNVRDEPIVNPYEHEPKQHLKLRYYRFFPTSPLGKTLIDVVGLNHQDRAITKRFEIGEMILENIENALDRMQLYKESRSTRNKNRLLSTVAGLLSECRPSSVYSATAATVLHDSHQFQEILQFLRDEGLMTSEIEEGIRVSAGIAFL